MNAVGNGGWSNGVSATTPATVPEVVGKFAATAATATAIDLTWTAPDDGGNGITGYDLERKTASGSYTSVPSSVAANATSYSDSGLSKGTAYTYRIRAVNAVGNSS